MDNRRGNPISNIVETKSNMDSRPFTGNSSKMPMSPLGSMNKKLANNRNKSKDKYFSQKNSQKVLLTKTSTSVVLTKQSVAQNDEKSMHITDKFMTEHDLSKIHEEGNPKEVKEAQNGQSSANLSEEIKFKVSKIFSNFAKFSKEEGDFLLSQQALIKILRYINIVNDKEVKLSDIDLLLKKVCAKGTKLNQEQFLDFTAQLAFKLDPENFAGDAKQTILNIVKAFFDPFVEFLENQNVQLDENESSNSQLIQLSIPSFLEKFEIEQRMVHLISSIYQGIKEVYQIYFKYENKEAFNYDQILKESFKSYLEFCRDYEITPFLLNMNQLVCYWNHVNNINSTYKSLQIFSAQKELGKVFTLSKFALMLVHFAIMTFSKFNQASYNYPEIGIPIINFR
jgi:hypothetical protein